LQKPNGQSKTIALLKTSFRNGEIIDLAPPPMNEPFDKEPLNRDNESASSLEDEK